jgi:hypothetical protein
MASPLPWEHDRAARDDRAAERDDNAASRDAHATVRDDAADRRDTIAAGRDEELLQRERELRRLLTAAERRHAAEDIRRESLARIEALTDELTAEQADIDQETHRSERALDAADLATVRTALDWVHDTYLADGRRDRRDAAGDRAGSRLDRAAAAADRTAAEGDREQSAVDDARHA